MRWPYRVPHILSTGMLEALQRVSKFIAAVDWQGFVPDHISGDLGTEEGILACAIGDGRRMMAWLVRKAEARKGEEREKLTIEGLEPGEYEVKYWDPWRSCWLQEERLTWTEGVTIQTPAFEKDLIIVMTLRTEEEQR